MITQFRDKSFDYKINLIRTMRADLRKLFPLDDHKSEYAWLLWIVTSGTKEYVSILECEEIKKLLSMPSEDGLTMLQRLIYTARTDVQNAYPLQENMSGFLNWFYTYGITEHNVWHLLNKIEQEIAINQPEPWARKISELYLNRKTHNIFINFDKREFGVNIIGYAFGQLGIGEDARMAAKACLAVDLPLMMLNFKPGADIPQNDTSMQEYVSENGKFAFNIFCMTALETARYYVEFGKRQFEGRYNIGYWPWELSKWPAEWQSAIDLVDEIWVSTLHTKSSLAHITNKPVLVMPMAVDIGVTSKKSRDDFGLPNDATLFCFSFDLNSSIHRKNPMACVNAFLSAFPKNTKENVALVIKTHKPKTKNNYWENLKTIAKFDERIVIVEQTLDRADLLGLYSCCDCFLSLHRAEGFGRGIAEALQLGLHVIATGYSGNVDFCKPPFADLVNYKLVKVKKREYPFANGQVWAEVDVAHAAELMRRFVKNKNNKLSKNDWSEFSTRTVGERYKDRLSQICNDMKA